MTSDPVAAAVNRLGADFPDLAAAVRPAFEVSARRAVEKFGMRRLHKHHPLSLLTTLDTLDRSDWSPSILKTLNAQARALAEVPGAPRVFRRFADCERGTMLGTVSELAFAMHLRACGARIEFEVAYTLISGGKASNPNVDILATWPWGSVAFDVYAPREQLHNTTSGFLDLRPVGLSGVVTDKVARKFGAAGATCVGLPPGALKVLAVDIAYNEAAFVGLHSPLGQNKEELQGVDLGGADGVLVFAHHQPVEGHPVVVQGVLWPSAGCAPVFKVFGLAAT